MTLLLIGLLVLLPNTNGENICEASGQCLNSILLAGELRKNATECLKSCKEYNGCKWYSYQPQVELCELFANCNEISETDCPDCVTGEVDCDIFKCNVIGQCQVKLLKSLDIIVLENHVLHFARAIWLQMNWRHHLMTV